MVRLTPTLFLPLLSVTLTTAASSVLDLIPSNFDTVVFSSGKPALVEFFAPWCGHCKNLAPIYEELGTAFSHASEKVSIAKVDADANKDLGKKFGVQGFPTEFEHFYHTEDGVEAQDEEGGTEQCANVDGFVVHKQHWQRSGRAGGVYGAVVWSYVYPPIPHFHSLTPSSLPIPQASSLTHLPTHPDCKSLAPVWEKLATTFSSEPSVLIAKVDAESPSSKSTAESQGVSSYPTIKFFPKGSTTPVPYSGGRSEDDFVSYINEKSGTHRTVDGNLDSLAGTVAAIDELLEKYVANPSAEALAEVQGAAKGAKDATAAYYVKVLEKMGVKTEYPVTEDARLQKMLKKGGLAREKVDDLTRRSNILKRFMPKEGKSEL
ncbi:MAG: hypothetical protein Q9160_006851 [Pyrenula sp. 1 TL-2023]